jgi:hypothetical protein
VVVRVLGVESKQAGGDSNDVEQVSGMWSRGLVFKKIILLTVKSYSMQGRVFRCNVRARASPLRGFPPKPPLYTLTVTCRSSTLASSSEL